LQLSSARVKTLNRVLYEAGIFVMRDDPQGKRYGRRGADKRIIEAYGFDLSLATRYEEFVRLAAEAQIERTRAKALRKRKTIARRGVHQAGETLASLGESLASCEPFTDSYPLVQEERITALNCGFSRSMTTMAASTRSAAAMSLRRTYPPSATASLDV